MAVPPNRETIWNRAIGNDPAAENQMEFLWRTLWPLEGRKH